MTHLSPAVQKVIRIVAAQSDNPAACYSKVGHAIFDDYNLRTGKYLYKASTDHAGWKAYIDDQYADMLRENRADIDFSGMLDNVLEAINALTALCLFDDDVLETAETYLHTYGMTRNAR